MYEILLPALLVAILLALVTLGTPGQQASAARLPGPAGGGDGSTTSPAPLASLTATELTAVELTAGYWHTCARLDNGAVKCWGYNGSGRLGLGDTVNRGDGPGEMGDALPAVDLGTGRTAVEIAAG